MLFLRCFVNDFNAVNGVVYAECFLAIKSWQWMPELANTTMDGYWRDLKLRALQPYGCAGSWVM